MSHGCDGIWVSFEVKGSTADELLKEGLPILKAFFGERLFSYRIDADTKYAGGYDDGKPLWSAHVTGWIVYKETPS